MINNELLKFVQEQLGRNVPKEQIIAILKPGGWSDADVSEALQALQTPAVPLLKTFPVHGGKGRTLLIVGIVIFALLLIAAGVWFFLFREKTSVSVVKQTVPVPETVPKPPPPVVSVPPTPFDSDLIVKWEKIPDGQNSASAINAAGGVISKADSDFLSKYFGKGYDVNNLPPLAEATSVAARNVKTLQAFFTASTTPFFQCSVMMTPERCNFQPVINIGRFLLLRSYVLEKAGKMPEALSITSSLVGLGRKITKEADDVVSVRVGWSLQKDGYQRATLLNPKLSTPFGISAEEKTNHANALRDEHKNVFRIAYTREAEFLEYLADKNKVPSFPQTADDIATADEYRKSIALGKFNLEETKKYFYDSYKTQIANVDVACGGPLARAPYDFKAEVNMATTTSNQSSIENYVGKILYWTTYTSFDSLNTKRCEVETLINKL